MRRIKRITEQGTKRREEGNRDRGSADSKPLVSVIIPVYNVKPWLTDCLYSVIGQTYRNLEIILVDDGSSDGSEEICDLFAEEDSRIIVIHQPNNGVSRARNIALEIASGEWISFVDADDLMPLYAIENMLQAGVRFEADVVIGGVMKFYGITPKREHMGKDEKVIIPSQDALLQMFYRKIDSYPHGKLYKRDLIGDIRFPDHMIFEDAWLVPDLIAQSRSVCILSQKVYDYRQTPFSIVRSPFSRKKMNQLDAAEHSARKYWSWGNSMRKALCSKLFFSCTDLLGRAYGFRGYKDEKARLVHGIKKTRKTVLFDRNNKLVDRLMALISFLHPEILAFFSYLGRIKQLSNLMWLEKKNKKIS